MSSPNYELARTVVSSSAAFAHANTMIVDAIIKNEEILVANKLTLDSLNDVTLIPQNIGEKRPDLIGRYLLVMIKVGQLNAKMPNLAKLSLQEKKEFAREYQEAAVELDKIAKEIG